MIKDTKERYGAITKIFHWTLGLLVICLIIVGFTMANMPPSSEKAEIYGYHKATGVIVLFLVSLRAIWRLLNTNVSLPIDLPVAQKLFARLTHYLLYLCMFMMPISGIMMSILNGRAINVFNIFTINPLPNNSDFAVFFSKIHHTLPYFLCTLIILHISGALYHHFIRKDSVLIRMIK